MHEEMALGDLTGAATVRLVGESWAQYLQRACARLKAGGAARRSDGARALVRRLKRTRPSTYQHCVRVARYSNAIGRALGFDDARLRQLGATAMLHDIGKILVPEAI